MNAVIKSAKNSKEVFTEEQCYIRELSNSADDPDVSIARATVKPGVTTRWHRLNNTIERYCIISGRGLVEVGELPPQTITAGDVALIPAMCRQRITNTGTEDLVFLAICTPRFKDKVYQNLEKS